MSSARLFSLLLLLSLCFTLLRAHAVFDSVDCDHVGVESSQNVCTQCVDKFSADFPLRAGDLAASYTAFPAQPCNWRGLAAKLAAAQNVTISVVGGSWTAGHGCTSKGPGCAWPARMEARLRAERQPNIKVTNLALGGWTYSTWIESGSLRGLAQQSDLVIIDVDVNAGDYIDTPVAAFQKDVDHTLFQLFKANPGVAVLAVN